MTTNSAFSATASRRGFLTGGAGLAAGMVLAGCSASKSGSSSSSSSSGGSSSGKFTLWNGWTGGNNQQMLGQILKNFENTGKDKISINNTAYPWDTLFSKWTLATASGNPPDAIIFHLMEVIQFGSNKVIGPIGDDIKKVKLDLSTVPKNVYDQTVYKGEQYAIPLDAFPLGLYINTELAQKAGLDPKSPPATADELKSWAEKLTTRSGNKIVQAGLDLNPNAGNQRWLWQTLTYQLGGELYKDGKWSVNSPEAKQAMQFIVDLIHKQKVSQVTGGTNSSGLDPFALKKAAMYFTGPWDVQFRLSQNLKFVTSRVPLLGKTPATWGGSHVVSVSSSTKGDARANSFLFFKWFYENYVQAATTVGTIPLNPAVLSSPAWTGDKRHSYYKPFQDSVNTMRYDPFIDNYTQLFPWGTEITPFTRMMSTALTGSATVNAALDTLQKALESGH